MSIPQQLSTGQELSAPNEPMPARKFQNLAGEWKVQLRPIVENTLGDSPSHSDESSWFPVHLPGALSESALGDFVGPNTAWIGDQRPALLDRPEFSRFQQPDNYKCPFWLQPERHFVGIAEYRRTVVIPDDWNGQRTVLTLERPHWRTKVFVDGKLIGEQESLSVPHRYEMTGSMQPGTTHELAVQVDNSLETLDVGYNSHSVSDHTQGAWNGVVGEISLCALPSTELEQLAIKPAPDARSVKLSFAIGVPGEVSGEVTVRCSVEQHGQPIGSGSVVVEGDGPSRAAELVVCFEKPADTWDEFAPNRCTLHLEIDAGDKRLLRTSRMFGMRQITTKGTQFCLNGHPIYLRGALDCCIFPLTGYPPTDVESWRRIIRVCKSYGLNHLRFHSWCPPRAAFEAADELGFYYQVECSSWPNQSTSLGDGKDVDQWLYREGERILREFGNHPSFLLFAMGNEPGGPENGGKYLRSWVAHFKSQSMNQLVTGGAGWPSIDENEFHVTPLPRIQQWGQELGSRINASPPATTADYREFVQSFPVPVISHEIGQWCVFPNLNEMEKYRGTLKPRNFEIFRDLLQERELLHHSDSFFMASGKLQALTYKEEIESALRTPGFGGFQLLGLQDFTGQGTALVGVVDPFWEPKPYIAPMEYRQFCAPTVPLCRMQKRIWRNNETLQAAVEVSHFGNADLNRAVVAWRVLNNGSEVGKGEWPEQLFTVGSLTSVGTVSFPLGSLTKATQLTLKVTVSTAEESFENEWKVWVYPAQLPALEAEVCVAQQLDAPTLDRLANGETVLLFASPNDVASDVETGFSPIFWSTAWTDGQAPHTLGILCEPKHAALQNFPTDYHSDWQWWEIVSRSRPLVLDNLPSTIQPVVQVVPDWFDPHKLALVFEARVGNGKILICSADLVNELPNRPAAQQLLYSLTKYAASAEFQPAVDVSPEMLKSLFAND